MCQKVDLTTERLADPKSEGNREVLFSIVFFNRDVGGSRERLKNKRGERRKRDPLQSGGQTMFEKGGRNTRKTAGKVGSTL